MVECVCVLPQSCMVAHVCKCLKFSVHVFICTCEDTLEDGMRVCSKIMGPIFMCS